MARVQAIPRPKLTAGQRTEIATRYIAGESAPKIGLSLGVSAEMIRHALRADGIKIRSNSEAQTKHTLRHDAFEVLTPDAAYWCGFLFTDGSVSRRPGRTPEVSVGLSECDRAHLEKLRAFLGSSHAITMMRARSATFQAGTYTSRAAYRFAVRSSELAERLCALGRYGGPIDDGLVQSRDFWRGVIDGDGSLGVSCDLTYLKVVGSRRLLEAYVRFLGRTGARRLHVRPHKTIYGVSATGATADRIVNRLYSDASTVLDRKADRAASILARALATPEPDPRRPIGGAILARRYAESTMCAHCLGDTVIAGGTVRINHEIACPVGVRLSAAPPAA